MKTLACLLALAGVPASDLPVFTPEGELVVPAGYREWTFLTSGLGMTYGPAAPEPNENPMFDNVFVNPSAFSQFKETGRWPEGTTFALEIRYSTSKGSINQGGHFQSDVAALEVAVKDTKRFPEGWAYFDFGGGVGPRRQSARALSAAAGCLGCHTKHGAVENTFTQFYPTALAVAEAKGTIKPDYVSPPPSPARFAHLLREKGWRPAEQLLQAARAQDPSALILKESALNRVAYGLLQEKETATAITLFQWIAGTFPGSANAHDSLAEAYEADGRSAQAIAETERAIALLDADTATPAARKERVRKACVERLARLKKP